MRDVSLRDAAAARREDLAVRARPRAAPVELTGPRVRGASFTFAHHDGARHRRGH